MTHPGRCKEDNLRWVEEKMFLQDAARPLCLDWRKSKWDIREGRPDFKKTGWRRVWLQMIRNVFLPLVIDLWVNHRFLSEQVRPNVSWDGQCLVWFRVSENSSGHSDMSTMEVGRAMCKQKWHGPLILSNFKLGQTHTKSGTL